MKGNARFKESKRQVIQNEETKISQQSKRTSIQLVDEMNGNIKSLNDNITNVTLESVLTVSGKAHKENRGKLSTATKDVIRKRSSMVIKQYDTYLKSLNCVKPEKN